MPTRCRQREIIEKARLYVVLDRAVAGHDRLFDILEQCVAAGVTVFQLRDKEGSGKQIFEFTRRAVRVTRGQAVFIVNDRLDVALAGGADGVHLGQDDLPVEEARRLVGNGFLIGCSCQTLEHLTAAVQAGADYVGFGSVFQTLTKPNRSPMDLCLLERAEADASIPLFAIGGIDEARLSGLVDIGVRRVAVTRAVCLSQDVPATVRRFEAILARVSGR